MRFALHDFKKVFDIRNARGEIPVLVGGQAVNYWAERYFAVEPALEAWLPFTSQDIDFHGRRDDVICAAKELGVRAQFPHKKQMTAWAGMLPCKIGETQTHIDFVRLVPGVPTHKIEAWAVAAFREDKRLRVLDPISLLTCKMHLALGIDQKERRDIDHMRVMLICVRGFLRETLKGMESDALPERGWLNAMERVLKIAGSSLGKKATVKLGADWQQALPALEIAASNHRAAVQLREKRLPVWSARMAGS